MMTKRDDALKQLGFGNTDTPTTDEINKKFKALALQYHPDKNPSAEAKQEFVKIADAREFLLKPRAEQDALEKAGNNAPIPTTFEELIQRFFSDHGGANNNRFHVSLTEIEGRSKTVTSFSFEFNTEEELLNMLPDNLVKIDISGSNVNYLTEERKELLMSALLQRQNLQSIGSDVGIFSDSQRERLKNHVKANREAILAKNKKAQPKADKLKLKRKVSLLNWTLFIGLCTLIACSANGLGFFATLLLTAYTSAITYVAKKLINFISQHFYKSEAAVHQATPNEKVALKAGVEAAHWKGYFTSYSVWQAYRHPLAFESAKDSALYEHERVIKAIKAS